MAKLTAITIEEWIKKKAKHKCVEQEMTFSEYITDLIKKDLKLHDG